MKMIPILKYLAAAIILFTVFSWVAADPVGGKLPPKQDAEALIRAWVQAQNKGNFSAYAALYHTAFNGIKRSGTRAYHFQYQDWLADRKKMFGAPFTVTVDNLGVAETAGAWTAGFVQTWESGTYKDRGAKIIVLKPVNGRLLIVKEEMLNSTVMAPSRNIVDFTKGGELFFVVDDKYIVFAHGYDAALGQGVPQGTTNDNPYGDRSALKRIDPAKVAKEYLNYLKEDFIVYDRKDYDHRTRISRLWLYTTYIPHFGETAYFESEGYTRSQILKQAWESGSSYQGNVFLVGELAESIGDGVWARRAKSALPVFYKTVPNDPVCAQVKTKGLEDLNDPSFLEKPDTSVETVAYRHPKTGKTFYMVLLTGGDPCGGEYFYEVTGVYEVKGRALSRIDAFNCPARKPAAVFDLDGDGFPEMFFDGGYGVVYQVESRTLGGNMTVPFLDCGC